MRFLVVLALAATMACGRHSPGAPSIAAGPTVLDVALHTASGDPIADEVVRAVNGSLQASCRTGNQGTCQIDLPAGYRGPITVLVSPEWFESAEQVVPVTADRTRIEIRLAPTPPGPLSGLYVLTVQVSDTCTDWPSDLRRVSVDLVLWQRGEGWWTELPTRTPACGFYGSVRGSDVDVHYITDCTQSPDAVIIADVGASRVLTMDGVGHGTITDWGIDADMDGVLAVEESPAALSSTLHACTAKDHRVVLTRSSGR